ncbi:MAG TPA: calcium/sodium antiporter [Acidobacteriota bacterium]|nr:calcium/sodium antiporter [Acidobacteriota bacterium]HQF88675.1 calcium/sodium antiporter [Acidobacteriota bacterium]HQG92965.1 calcium/sodium antiporter [Acidobacteriota bacterium]HQK87101.1 calcium/sodium antiporter [Acidobacteriota bacterium]
MITLILFILGVALLGVGGELLVRGASGLARCLGIPSLIVGLTVVAFGTSAPEAAVSLFASLAGQADIALGNVVGSNILNVLLILGVSAAIVPLLVNRQLLRFDVPVMTGVSVLVWVLALNGTIGRWEGFLLLALLAAYTVVLVILSRRARAAAAAANEAPAAASQPVWLLAVFVVGGLILLVLGSRWFVDGAVAFARLIGVSELVIGLTIVALGTSLPEVASSVIAAIRHERDIAVGNIIGSNIFNLLFVLGLAATVSPAGVTVAPAAARFDIPVMVVVALVCLPIFFTGRELSRWEGWLFLGYYAAYTTYLVLHSAKHQALPWFSAALLYFALPFTGLVLIAHAARAVRKSER